MYVYSMFFIQIPLEIEGISTDVPLPLRTTLALLEDFSEKRLRCTEPVAVMALSRSCISCADVEISRMDIWYTYTCIGEISKMCSGKEIDR